MPGLDDLRPNQPVGKAVLHIDEAFAYPFTEKVFHGPGHGCRGFAAAHHEDTIKRPEVQHLLGLAFLMEQKPLPVKTDKAPHRFIGVDPFQRRSKKPLCLRSHPAQKMS